MQFSEFDLSLIEASSDYISVYDSDLLVRMWNNALARKYGIAPHTAVGKRADAFFTDTEDTFRIECLTKSLKEGRSFYFSGLPYLNDQGFYSELIIPIHDHKQSLNGVISIARDHAKEKRYLKLDLLNPLLK